MYGYDAAAAFGFVTRSQHCIDSNYSSPLYASAWLKDKLAYLSHYESWTKIRFIAGAFVSKLGKQAKKLFKFGPFFHDYDQLRHKVNSFAFCHNIWRASQKRG